MQAFLVLLRYDLGQMVRSWIVRAWVALLVIPAGFLVGIAASNGELASETMAFYQTFVLAPLSWLAVSIFAASAISGEAGVMADAILSKSVNRTEYMTSKVVSRIGATLIVYTLVTLPFAYLLNRYGVPDATASGIFFGGLMVATMVSFLAALGILLSTVFRNVQLAILLVMVTVLFSGAVLQFLGLKWMSTTAVLNELPATFRGETPLFTVLRVVIVFGALTAASVAASLYVFRQKDL
jgi:ABC-type transport system involved in multi-copper enzyme maturation permease subunit